MQHREISRHIPSWCLELFPRTPDNRSRPALPGKTFIAVDVPRSATKAITISFLDISIGCKGIMPRSHRHLNPPQIFFLFLFGPDCNPNRVAFRTRRCDHRQLAIVVLNCNMGLRFQYYFNATRHNIVSQRQILYHQSFMRLPAHLRSKGFEPRNMRDST